ncbi:excisionase family DNA binding protein [Rhizobium soli]|uniref:Excisionase family DNA binding protein n=1 Tax=Rhizobium soli TaxID=424798 RepID=A0A7X0JNR7_9HYPH|nr:helix-turn-helix domain-containing protein [Rhizobium soli]MBB6511003.1 excisionase family DNA binding protein [Rhizobium soli]
MYVTPITYTVANAIKATGLSRSTLYNLMKAKQLPYIKVGKRTLLKVSDIEALLESGRETCH